MYMYIGLTLTLGFLSQEGFQSELGNRQLLWHGSRLTNWAGILSQGLRIAPPEAPSTGYMFGKGVYFAGAVPCPLALLSVPRVNPWRGYGSLHRRLHRRDTCSERESTLQV